MSCSKWISLFYILLSSTALLAQNTTIKYTPHLMYSGKLNLKNKSKKKVTFKCILLADTNDLKNIVYWEYRTVVTGPNGEFQLNIGAPDVDIQSQDFNNIDWENNSIKYMGIQLQIEKETPYQKIFFTPISNVPQAFYAINGGNSGYNYWKSLPKNKSKTPNDYLKYLKKPNDYNFIVNKDSNNIAVHIGEIYAKTPPEHAEDIQIIEQLSLQIDDNHKLSYTINGVTSNSITLQGKIISGHGTPNQNIGKEGDIYFDIDKKEFYAPKTKNGWTHIISQQIQKKTLPKGGRSKRVYTGH